MLSNQGIGDVSRSFLHFPSLRLETLNHRSNRDKMETGDVGPLKGDWPRIPKAMCSSQALLSGVCHPNTEEVGTGRYSGKALSLT